ncbi:hypothetical protein HJFPF1_11348 [Paramyrothecium foliicola]|nr:hypothetical protein HJFPF1_11348 [Paramyrothecium foliicola]
MPDPQEQHANPPSTFSRLPAAEAGTADPMGPSVESSQDIPRPGVGYDFKVDQPFKLDHLLASDPSHRIAPMYPHIGGRAQISLRKRLERNYADLVKATISDSPRLAEFEKDSADSYMQYISLVLNEEAIHRLNKPSKETIDGFVKHLREAGEGTSELPSEVRDWISLYQSQPLEDWMYSLLDTPLGQFLFKPLEVQTQNHGELTYLQYSTKGLWRVRWTLLNLVVAFLFGVPVAVLSLDLISRGWSVAFCWVHVDVGRLRSSAQGPSDEVERRLKGSDDDDDPLFVTP